MDEKLGKLKPEDDLRRRAKERLFKNYDGSATMPVVEAKELVHELEVHQIELEMQNEELRRAQLELEESRDNYADLYDFSPVAYLTYDSNGVILEANLTAAKLLNIDRKDLINNELHRFILSSDKDTLYHHNERVFSVKGKHNCELQLKTSKDTRVDILLESVVIYKEGDTTEKCRSVLFDITQRKSSEEQSQRLRTILSNVINSMPSVLVCVDSQIGVTHWNREAECITGIVASDAEGQLLVDVFPRMADWIEVVLEAIRSRQVQRVAKLALDIDERTVLFDLIVYPLTNTDIGGAVIRMDDITERIRLENILIQSEKMRSVGTLAAGMAHEINNPLSGIMQCTQTIERRLSSDLAQNEAVAQHCGISLKSIQAYMDQRGIVQSLQGIRESSSRAAIIVQNMLQFTRNKNALVNRYPVADLIEHSLMLAAQEFSLETHYDFRKIKIVQELEPNLPEVLVVNTEIEQVLLNILQNGAYAMQNNPRTKPQKFTLRARSDGQMIRIEVEDNGPGIPKEICSRIFEPFFTTKEVGSGTGLGLSVSHMIITQNHSGEISVESIPDVATKFIIKLPVAPVPVVSR